VSVADTAAYAAERRPRALSGPCPRPHAVMRLLVEDVLSRSLFLSLR
jgi:hypothetical protein